ncbi:MAG TPA: TRAP transporter substrate-binding protein DctP [Reyranella sp.]|jgi:C4-dicarboxylate-binding protein DctP|nr:TRAP transporter substrate-binding protein DctP [Reyranella sp.]
MSLRIHRRALFGAAAATLAAPAALRAAEPLKLRCSLDTAPSHPRNVAIVDYMAKLEKASNGEIKGEVFHSGQLFADLNVSKALLQGQVEMAAPGAWVLTGLVPDCDMVQLPYFYGVPTEVTHKATDGKPGAKINSELEAKLNTHVLGPWIDLGYQNWYSTKTPLDSFAALKGLKIRSPGGAAISWRIKFAGGIANTTAWPNVPLALSQGTFDAFVSTDESCNSAKLWEAGVKYSYADHQFMGQYIPQLAKGFWAKLSDKQQKLMTDLWAENIAGYRKGAAESQANARKVLEKNGVKFHDPSADELDKTRKAMIGDVASLIKDAKLSPDIVKLVKESVGTA